jgi:hypothetical protein
VAVAEQFADGAVKETELDAALRAYGQSTRAVHLHYSETRGIAAVDVVASVAARPVRCQRVLNGAVKLLARDEEHALAVQSDLIRDIFCSPSFQRPKVQPTWVTWNESCVVKLAQAVYVEREMPQGTLDKDRLAILADALEDAGCDNADILNHCRGPGPHVRGCWVVDLILGKS